MSIRRWLILGWMAAGLQVLSAGQNPPPQNQPAQDSSADSTRTAPVAALSAIAGMQGEGDAEDTNNDLPNIPAMLGGAGISSAFISELERSNYLRGGVNVGAVYDSNPLLLSSGTESGTSESFFPNIRIEESSSRVRWMLGYAGGLTVNQNITDQNWGSQNLNFDSQYRLSPHVNLRVAESFSMTTGFFDAGNGTGVVAGSGGPNASLIAPLSTQRSSMTTVETNYHFALNDLIGASGSFYDIHFTNVPAGTQLTDSQTASGTAFWLHRILRGDWGGASYGFQRITFSPSGETRVNSFFAVDTLSLSKQFTLTGFLGPQYLENQGLAPGALPVAPSNNWSVAGGMQGGWANQRTGVSAGFSRNISDGGGVMGAVRLQTVNGTFRRALVPGWTAALAASYGTNQLLTFPLAGSASSINMTSVGVSLERDIGKSIGIRMGYTHDFQERYFAATPPALTQDTSRNRIFVTFSYQWAKPLGM
ncbi:MAG: hypothetical protein ABSF66_00200 [Terriglobales bacterium]|jgi:hypothetical protein